MAASCRSSISLVDAKTPSQGDSKGDESFTPNGGSAHDVQSLSNGPSFLVSWRLPMKSKRRSTKEPVESLFVCFVCFVVQQFRTLNHEIHERPRYFMVAKHHLKRGRVLARNPNAWRRLRDGFEGNASAPRKRGTFPCRSPRYRLKPSPCERVSPQGPTPSYVGLCTDELRPPRPAEAGARDSCVLLAVPSCRRFHW